MSTSKPFVLDLDDVFDRYIESQQKVWSHDRALTVGASEIFTCLRSNWFKKRGEAFGFKPDEDYVERWGAMQRGNVMEDYHVAPAFLNCLPKPLKTIYAGQKDQKTFVLDKNSATPDGLILDWPEGPAIIKCRGHDDIKFTVGDEKCIGLEIKSIDPRARLDEERDKHHGQSQVGMGLVRELTEYKPGFWLILYVEASFWDNMTPFLVEWNPEVYASAKLRAPKVYETDNPMDLPAEGKFTGDCDHCKYTRACGEAILSHFKQMEKEPPEIDDLAANAMAPLVQRFLTEKQEADDAQFTFNVTKEELKTKMADMGTNKLIGPNWRISWSPRKGKETLDKQSMIDDGIDIEKYTKTGKAFDVLTVTVKD